MISLEYLAGIIDGEGCLDFHIPKKHLYFRMRVTMTSQVVVNAIYSTFGGSFNTTSGTDKNRTTFTWQLVGTPACLLLTKIYPYLLEKKEQAKLAMQFFQLQENDNKEINEYFIQQMQLLKKYSK